MKIEVKNSGIVKLISLKDKRRGDLFAAEAMKEIPFPIRRVYFVNNIKNASAVRGMHAHKRLSQVIFCANGSFVLNLDDGERKQKVLMDNPSFGIILGPKLWHTMSELSKNCVILIFASARYDEHDYIRNYGDFLKTVKASKKT